MAKFKMILVPVDFSEHAAAALEVAVEIAKAFGSKIRLLHCYQILPGGISPYGVVLPSTYYDDIRQAAEKQLQEWQERLTPRSVEVESTLMSEFPSHAIALTAEEIGADLIVMGTRGLSGIKHVMLGSIAERTVRIARCPVLTVKA